MKIRNLEAQYDNLFPQHVWGDSPVPPEYQKLWDYARNLEIALQKSRDRTNMYKREVQVINKAMWRKHTLLEPVRWLARIVRWYQNVFEN